MEKIMKRVNFNIEVRELDTKDKEGAVIPGSIAAYVGGLLINPQFREGDVLKKLLLAQRIAKEEEIEIDKADYDLIMKAIKNPGSQVPPLVEGQLRLKLEAIKWD